MGNRADKVPSYHEYESAKSKMFYAYCRKCCRYRNCYYSCKLIYMNNIVFTEGFCSSCISKCYKENISSNTYLFR